MSSLAATQRSTCYLMFSHFTLYLRMTKAKQKVAVDIMEACAALKIVRTDNNLSLETVEVLADIPKAAISKYERGTQIPKVTTLERWATALGCQVEVSLKPA